MLVGIDEAGRGPVFGSLFVAGVRTPVENTVLQNITESKQTTNRRVREIAEILFADSAVDIVVFEITASTITNCKNLSEKTLETMVRIARVLCDGKTELFVDACHSDTSKTAAYFDSVPVKTKHIENKADETFPIVGAAGCVAKAFREMHIERLSSKYTYDIGSGYPSDTTTRDFLKTYYEENTVFPPETRLSWSTCDTIRDEVEDR